MNDVLLITKVIYNNFNEPQMNVECNQYFLNKFLLLLVCVLYDIVIVNFVSLILLKFYAKKIVIVVSWFQVTYLFLQIK